MLAALKTSEEKPMRFGPAPTKKFGASSCTETYRIFRDTQQSSSGSAGKELLVIT